MNDKKQPSISTLGLRGAKSMTPEGEHSEPIFATSSYVFESAAEAASIFAEEKSGNIYSRFTNPTVQAFETRLAKLEGGERCVATASGMSAILSTVMALLSAGDHVVLSKSVFGSTIGLFNNYFARFGIECSFVSPTDIDEWQQAIKDNTKLFFCETPSNPLSEIVDVSQLSALSKQHDILLAVDNCFCTPALQRPIELGADIVIHSATKYLDGQGRCVGGAVVGPAEPMQKVFYFMRTAGPCMSPFNAWVFLKGLETLDLRMKAHSEQALDLANWLEAHPKVARVYYSGLASHPQHELATTQQSGFGGVLAFEVKGKQKEAWQVIDSTELLSITANLGDVRTTITHPATTTHHRLSPEMKKEAGITESLIRIAVGLENIDDIKADLARGLG